MLALAEVDRWEMVSGLGGDGVAENGQMTSQMHIPMARIWWRSGQLSPSFFSCIGSLRGNGMHGREHGVPWTEP